MSNDPPLPPSAELPDPPDFVIENFGADFHPPPRILVADDDAMFGNFLQRFFQREKCECDHVLEAAAAERHLREREYDLLVSDIFMPGNVGLELIEHLPQIVGGLPVILLTGRPTVETAARSVRLSVSAYLTKPPDLVELRKEARQAILRCRNLRTIANGRARLAEWQHSMEEIETILRETPARGQANQWNRYLSLTLQNLFLTLVELKQISENVAVAEALGPGLQRAELLSAVQRTITVLRNTRQHFKSKDLGDLRHELEAVLETANPKE
jgi:DNA-binding response OmpR family regulator